MTKHYATPLRTLAFSLSFTMLTLAGCKHHSTAVSLFSSSDYPGQLEALASSPVLPALRWPNYGNYKTQVDSVYSGHDGDLIWVSGDDAASTEPTAAAKQMIDLFEHADLKGLSPEDYDGPRWAARLDRLAKIRATKDSSTDAQRDVAEFDLAMTVSAVRYLNDLHEGRINPQSLNFDIDVPSKRAAFDVVKLLNDSILTSSDVASAVSSVEPQNPLYKATEAALPRYLELAKRQAAEPPTPLPELATGVKPLVVGDHYAAADALLARLQLEGDAPVDESTTAGESAAAKDAAASTAAAAKPASTVYTKSLSEAVKRFQDRNGLEPDGKLGQGTIHALNVTMAQDVQKMDDTLERFRWLPEEYQQPRILVNLPEFMLRAYGPDHSPAFTMRVVDGEAKGFHDTPMFVRLMRYVVFRPYWNLPPSIIKKEIVPHLQKSGIGYLAAHDYEATTRGGTVVPDPTVSDIAHLRYAIRQKPGPKNSLGLVKFLFPNEYDVYMHSTPELALFGLSRRDKSHGCVRLQHADQMALWVLGGDQKDPVNQTTWDMDSVHDAMNAEDKNNKTVGLRTPLPVVITYMTALAEDDGTVHFFNDIYGYDKDLETALAKGRPYPQGAVKINPKLTPGETE